MIPEQNKNYILNNLDKYIIDGKGDFINLEKDYNDSDYTIWKNEVVNYEETKKRVIQEIIKDKSKWKLITNKEIIEDIMEAILLEKDNWEIVYKTYSSDQKDPEKYKHRQSGAEIEVSMCDTFTFEQAHILLGELGYRGPGNEDYDEWGHYRTKEWWQKRNWKKDNKNKQKNEIPSSPNSQSQQQETEKLKNQEGENLTPLPPSKTNPPQAPNPAKETNSPNKQNKNNLSPEKEKDKPTNPLPTPTDIQTHYNSDKAQAEIANNPNLTDTKEKQKAEELLKIIITAELLIKEAKTNSEILTKLLNKKKSNSSVYQLLNKENRIDQVINQLQNIEKNNNSATNNQNQQNKNPSSFKIIIPIGLSLLAIVGIAVLVKMKKKQNN